MKKTIQLANIETRSHWLADMWAFGDLTVDQNPAYISSMGEARAAVSGICGKRQSTHKAPEAGQDPMCSFKSIALSAESDPFDRWLRAA